MIVLHIFTEEPSLKEVLDIIVPKIIPQGVYYQIYPHQGKQDLEKALKTAVPSISKIPGARIIITRDQDNDDCRTLKSNLERLIAGKINCEYKIRIICKELESWFLGDLAAVEAAYNRFRSDQYSNRTELRDVDAMSKPSEFLRRIIPEYSNLRSLPKLTTAQRIGANLDINNNRSESFNQMVAAIKELTDPRTPPPALSADPGR